VVAFRARNPACAKAHASARAAVGLSEAQREINERRGAGKDGRLVRLGVDEPCHATMAQIATRLEPHPDALMLLTAVGEAVERYDPSREAAILLEVPSGHQVLILSSERG
jgi:hypothetical protein